MLIGQTDGGRVLALVIERTLDPNSWEIVTGWTAARASVRCLDDEREEDEKGPLD